RSSGLASKSSMVFSLYASIGLGASGYAVSRASLARLAAVRRRPIVGVDHDFRQQPPAVGSASSPRQASIEVSARGRGRGRILDNDNDNNNDNDNDNARRRQIKVNWEKRCANNLGSEQDADPPETGFL
ncbi:MAG: hypothetical protein LJE69_19115, partial [Thiohalocapsa sp.]|uniref:hypothetical protein n=1 Tax=Thiohalocapsa sp. TaxID=2497641 RepID=UPI0025D0B616